MWRPLFALLVLLPFSGCSPRVARAEPQARETSFHRTLGDFHAWEIAFVRDGRLWIERVGDSPTLVAEGADSPAWSHDGRLLAFRQGSKLKVLDFDTDRTDVVVDDPALRDSRPSGFDTDPLQMTFDPVRPMLAVATGPGLRLFPLSQVKVGHRDDILEQNGWDEKAPTWSASGSKLAFTRSGDIWIALRDVERWKTSIPLEGGFVDDGGYSVDYYDDARRLAPLAVWNDGETGVSARTPYWVDGLAWTADEKRLVFHFQRYGGSGVSEIGYLELEEDDEDRSWDTQSGFRVKVHWLKLPHDLVFHPGIAPDGKTLSYLADDRLYLSDWGREELEVKAEIEQYAWRPVKRG